MSRTHEVCWAAGFFDGEGYITIQKRGHKNYIGHYLRIGINHVAIEPLLEMQRLFGGNISEQNPEKVIGNRKPRHGWNLSTSKASETLKQLLPYLRNKNKVAALALDFQETIQSNKQKIPDSVVELRESLKTKITALNSLD
jgi:hypothetical protein